MASPKIGDGVCGSPLVRVRMPGENRDFTLSKGQIGAFMHWSNVRDPYSSGPRFLCFYDSVQPLIDRQWEIANSDSTDNISEVYFLFIFFFLTQVFPRARFGGVSVKG